jgi:hypothetical protein
LHRDLARANTVALVFDGRLGGGGVDGRFAEYLHRRVFDVEDALVSLAGVVLALSAEQAPEAHAAAAAQLKALAAAAAARSGHPDRDRDGDRAPVQLRPRPAALLLGCGRCRDHRRGRRHLARTGP